jgi:hypothetical protein
LTKPKINRHPCNIICLPYPGILMEKMDTPLAVRFEKVIAGRLNKEK